MGGRGASSEGGMKQTAFSVTDKNGEVRQYKITKVGNKNFIQRGIGNIPEDSPLNMTASEFRRRAESNGNIVKKISVSNWNKEEKARAEEQAHRPDYALGMGLKDNRSYRKQARINRSSDRAVKRSKRNR